MTASAKRKMPAKTLRALKASIKKWEKCAAGEYTRDEVDDSDCALCQLFPSDCTGCPVMEKTRLEDCEGTPFYAARDALYWIGPRSIEFKKAAKKELAFLKRLLPKEDRT